MIQGRRHDLSTHFEFNSKIVQKNLIYRLKKHFQSSDYKMDELTKEAVDFIFSQKDEAPNYKCLSLKKIANDFGLAYKGMEVSVYVDERPIYAIMLFLTKLSEQQALK